jgi:hypothetical protein
MLRKNELVNEVNQILLRHYSRPVTMENDVANKIVERVLELIQK